MGTASAAAAIEILLGVKGGDLPAKLADDLQLLGLQQEELVASFEKGDVSATKAVDGLAKIQRQAQKTRDAIAAINEIPESPLIESLPKIDVALNSLIVTGLKWQDVLAKQARLDDGAAMRQRIDAYAREEEAAEKLIRAKERESNAWQFNYRQASTLKETLLELAENERTAATATVQLTAAQGKAGASVEQASKSAGYGAYKWLLLSNAVQDAQYGLSSVVNNVPGIVQAFGGSAGLAGAAQGAAVAFQVFGTQISYAYAAMANPLSDHLTKSIGDVKAELSALEGKKIRSLVEQSAVEQLDEAIDKLTKINTALAAQKGLTLVQKNVGDIVNAGIKEATGGTPAKLYDAIAASRSGEVSSGMARLQQDAKEAMQRLEARRAGGEDVTDDIETAGFEYHKRLDKQRAIDRANRRTAAEEMAGRAGSGDEQALKYLSDLYDAHPKQFAAYGVNPNFRKTLDQAQEQTTAGLSAKASKEQERQAAASEAYYDKEDVNNADERSKGMEKLRTDYEKKQAADAKKAATARNAQIKAEASRVGGAFDDNLKDVMLDYAQRGQTPASRVDNLTNQLQGRLGARGVPADMAADVARRIVQQVADKTQNELDSRNDTGDMRGNAHAMLVDEHRKVQRADRSEDKARARDAHDELAGTMAGRFQQQYGANDAQATHAGEKIAKLMEAGTNADAAAMQVYREMTGAMDATTRALEKQTIAAEQMRGVIGQATIAAGMAAEQASQQTINVNFVKKQLQRGQKQRPFLFQY